MIGNWLPDRRRRWIAVGVATVAAIAATGAAGSSSDPKITTVAGQLQAGFFGDGGPATAAYLSSPSGIAVDAQGNLYVRDSGNYRVRKVTPDGKITRFAGTGRRGDEGDGGPATSAQLSTPGQGLAVDGQGNVYIADAYHIRKVSRNGIITTIAGTGQYGFSGEGVPARLATFGVLAGLAADEKGNVYVADQYCPCVRKVSAAGLVTTFAGVPKRGGFSGDGGPATLAQLKMPTGVAVDRDGNVFIADGLNNRVRKVSPQGTITTVAGGGGTLGDGGPATSARLNVPEGVAVDAKGNLYIADLGHNRVRKVSPGGTITTVAGGGTSTVDGVRATSALLNLGESYIAVDAKGVLYISETGNNRVRKVVAGTPPPPSVTLPRCSKAEATAVAKRLKLGMAESLPDPVYAVICGSFRGPKSRTMVITLATGDGSAPFKGWAVVALVKGKWRLVMESDDAARISAAGRNIRETVKVPGGGTRSRLWHWDGTKFEAGAWTQETPASKATKPARIIITTVAGSGAHGFGGDGGAARAAKLAFPTGVAVDAKGNIYIADRINNRVRKVTPGGTITTFAGTGEAGFTNDGEPATTAELNKPEDVAVDRRGNVYIADTGNQRIRRVSLDGTITTFAGTGRYGFSGDGGRAISASMAEPIAVAVDRRGNVYIGDWRNSRVRKVTGGRITTLAGTGRRGFSGDGGPAAKAQIRDPHAVTVDGRGAVYIADGPRVRKVSLDGTITTIAGAGGELTFPEGLAVDGKGNVYISDFGDNQVKKVSRAGKLTTIAGAIREGFSGDGGPALSARLNHPLGMALDGRGNVYISDSGNARIRRIGTPTPKLMLDGAATQELLAQNDIIVKAGCADPCALSATGSVTVADTEHVFELTPATAGLAAGSRTLTLRLPAGEQERFRQLLAPGQRAQAVITVTATDKAGNTATSELTVAIR
jgi:sugar lactone lactonase YvrE